MTRYALLTMLLAVPLAAAPANDTTLSFVKVWTHGHTHPGQVSEIPAFDSKTNTVWVAGVVGVDVLDAQTGALVEHIDVTGYGLVNSVAIRQGLAAFAVEAAPDRRRPGVVLFFDTRIGTNLRTNVGMDFEPEYIAVEHDDSRAFVTLQEANAIAVLDCSSTNSARSSDSGRRISAFPGMNSTPRTTTAP